MGRSLGVNNIPYKTCTYSCIYCQLGRTVSLTVERRFFYDPEDIIGEVVRFIGEAGSQVDYITFVPDGEPLLDRGLGREIRGIKERVQTPVAVLTNTSLLFYEDVRSDLLDADLVSLKVDAVTEGVWRRVNRPHPSLNLARILEGAREFARAFKGKLITETMLVEGFNTSTEEMSLIAELVRELNPWKAYLAIPIRPPAESYVKPPPPGKLVEAYVSFSSKLGTRVELLNIPEPPELAVHGDAEKWLLNLVSVHPLRLEYAIEALSGAAEEPENLLERLVEEGEIEIVTYLDNKFVVRAWRKSTHRQNQ